MKKFILTLSALLVAVAAIVAQDISEVESRMSLGKQVGFTVDIDGAEDGMAEKVWKKYVKEFGKAKRNKKAKEQYIVDAKIPMIAGSDKVNIYAKFDERVGMTTATVWVDHDGGFVNYDDQPSEARGTEEFLGKFYVAVKEYAINEEMTAQEKELKKLDKELRKLEKKNTGYHKDIEKAKEAIEKAEKNIEQNLKDQEDQQVMIEKQKKMIEKTIERLNAVGKKG